MIPDQTLPPAPRNIAWQLGRRFMIAVEKGDLRRMRAISAEAELAYLNDDDDSRPDRNICLSRISPKFAKILFDGALIETPWDLSQCRRSEICRIPDIPAQVVIWCDQVLKKRGLCWMPEEGGK